MTYKEAFVTAFQRWGYDAIVGYGAVSGSWELGAKYSVGRKLRGEWLCRGLGNSWEEAFKHVAPMPVTPYIKEILMSDKSIGKINIPQTVVREPYQVRMSHHSNFLSLINNKGIPVIYYRDDGKNEKLWTIRALLSGDKVTDVGDEMFLGTVQIDGLTLHFFGSYEGWNK